MNTYDIATARITYGLAKDCADRHSDAVTPTAYIDIAIEQVDHLIDNSHDPMPRHILDNLAARYTLGDDQ